MSYSLSVTGKKDELATKLEETFADNDYGDAQEYVAKAVTVGKDALTAFAASIEDDGDFGVSFYGHANYGENDSVRDSFYISVAPIMPQPEATEVQ